MLPVAKFSTRGLNLPVVLLLIARQFIVLEFSIDLVLVASPLRDVLLYQISHERSSLKTHYRNIHRLNLVPGTCKSGSYRTY
eukprot:SAG31_NODE_240_length_19407_cov_29.686140_21_plen_82_part_00